MGPAPPPPWPPSRVGGRGFRRSRGLVVHLQRAKRLGAKGYWPPNSRPAGAIPGARRGAGTADARPWPDDGGTAGRTGSTPTVTGSRRARDRAERERVRPRLGRPARARRPLRRRFYNEIFLDAVPPGGCAVPTKGVDIDEPSPGSRAAWTSWASTTTRAWWWSRAFAPPATNLPRPSGAPHNDLGWRYTRGPLPPASPHGRPLAPARERERRR